MTKRTTSRRNARPSERSFPTRRIEYARNFRASKFQQEYLSGKLMLK